MQGANWQIFKEILTWDMKGDFSHGKEKALGVKFCFLW